LPPQQAVGSLLDVPQAIIEVVGGGDRREGGAAGLR